ncbi:MAG: methyltransferase [Bacteroidia bacterium]
MPNRFSLRQILKRLLFPVLRPLADWYLGRTRKFTWKNIEVTVVPGVFHPGLFISTKILLNFLLEQTLSGKKFLELGAGSGIISVFAAKQGAIVTASDISLAAVSNIRSNAANNGVIITTIHSDLFEALPEEKFDIIVINPPYYPRKPQSEKEYAFYCGEEFEYFERLFKDLPGYISSESATWMILSEDCDLQRISRIAANNHLAMEEIFREKQWGEWNYIFQLGRMEE